MKTNASIYFINLNLDDPDKQIASTLYQILIQPGYFMLQMGINDEDLDNEVYCENKILEWLKAEGGTFPNCLI